MLRQVSTFKFQSTYTDYLDRYRYDIVSEILDNRLVVNFRCKQVYDIHTDKVSNYTFLTTDRQHLFAKDETTDESVMMELVTDRTINIPDSIKAFHRNYNQYYKCMALDNNGVLHMGTSEKDKFFRVGNKLFASKGKYIYDYSYGEDNNNFVRVQIPEQGWNECVYDIIEGSNTSYIYQVGYTLPCTGSTPGSGYTSRYMDTQEVVKETAGIGMFTSRGMSDQDGRPSSSTFEFKGKKYKLLINKVTTITDVETEQVVYETDMPVTRRICKDNYIVLFCEIVDDGGCLETKDKTTVILLDESNDRVTKACKKNS